MSCGEGSITPPLEQISVDTLSYRLGRGNRLKLGIFKADDVSGESLVSDSGAIAIPLIGEVKAAGPTVRELGDTIQTKLETGGYFRDPKVSIQILTYRPVLSLAKSESPGSILMNRG
jgi:protein involved in polysaccharide export with SLBB domain